MAPRNQNGDEDAERRAPLKGHENAEVRDVLESRRRWRWLWWLLGKSALTAFAAGSGWLAIRSGLADLIKFLSSWKG